MAEGVTMAEGVHSGVAVDNDSSDLSSAVDSESEISEYDAVSDLSLSPRVEVEPYLFEPEWSIGESSINSELEDSVEPAPYSTGRVGNNNWYVNKC